MFNKMISFLCIYTYSKGPSWSWLYGCWIYNYLCNQCLSCGTATVLQLSVPITNKVVSSNPVYGEVYSIQHYVIKFVKDLRQVSGSLQSLRFPPSIKTDCHDITEILLKVVLNTITQPITPIHIQCMTDTRTRRCLYTLLPQPL
jgi:hypothetical protein